MVTVDGEISQLVDEMLDKTTECNQTDSEDVEKAPSSPKITLKAKTSGIGALLSNLRSGDGMSASTSADSDEPLMKRTKADEQHATRPLNRKERRALKQAELKEKYEASKTNEKDDKEDSTPAPFLYEKAIPPIMTIKHMDEQSYHDYKATFGYTCTRNNNYVRFALQSPSGEYAAVASQDRYVRVYNMKSNENPNIEWKHNMGGLIYDLVWLKGREEECFATTSKDHPVHLWNAKTGERMAAYIGKDHADAVEAALCVGQVGDLILGGYKKDFKIWDIERGGKPVSSLRYYDTTYGTGLTGRAMSIDENPTMQKLFATVGCTDRIVVYSQQWNSAVSTISGPGKSYTHVRYSLDGHRIFASERKGDIHVFDVRMNMCCQIMKREMKSNHRSVFDIDFKNRLLYSGTSSGDVVAFDICDYNEEINPVSKLRIASTCVPCVSFSSSLSTLACCSGERFFPQSNLCDSDEDNENKLDSVTLYPSNSFQVLDISF